MKVLLPVDGSPFTEKMLGYVTSQTAIFKPEYEYVLQTIVAPLLPQAAGLMGKEAVNKYYTELAEETLEKAIVFMKGKGFNFSSGYKIGYVSELLPEEADNGGYDLVVMGTHGHGAFGNLVLGSVANAMLSKSAVPVLLIR